MDMSQTTKTETIAERYQWELKAWFPKLGSLPVEVLESADYGGYEWESGILFKLESGQYGLVTGSGCSCNDFGDDGDAVTVYQNEVEGRRAYQEWNAGVSDYYKKGD